MSENTSIHEQLASFVGTWKKVRLTRRIPSERLHNGCVLGVGTDWVLFQQFHDFSPEGFTTLRLRDIKKIRSGEYERQFEKMLSAEGLLGLEVIPNDLPLDNIADLLSALKERGQNIIIECEDLIKDIQDFYIGRILSVDQKSVSFIHFNALGRWKDDPVIIPFREITRLEFETPYIKIFSKYVEEPQN